ncbi:MAG: 2Fe-2S iron-sulfur cluster binding domain-containing protein [Spirochaetes bacterium]|uniref:2Fe-2S iron-sulfur cluster binding domain-containing protein n=1 Tax=Candidatus Avitreponema avistercoris TaxID=2840705 RepID=A0A9D9EPA9_9SPIR|nr:2Fe-2S iron-sulfur cluster binding domain-containing protein [Candidatus Avitreponema avistercoris]
MIIPFTLNGEKLYLDARAGDRLVHILRQRFDLTETKESCCTGTCGVCTVLMNDVPVPSCMIPAFQIRNCRIVTLSHFKKTEDYQDIKKALDEAKISLCGFCDAGKILTAYAVLLSHEKPGKQEIKEEMSGISCQCTNPDDLAAAIQKAAAYRRQRLA